MAGEPLIGRVVRLVAASGVAARVIVATDHGEIARVARGAGAEVWLDDAAYRSGSDRVAAAVEQLADEAEVVLNVQGDEALVSPPLLEAAVAALPGNMMGTVACPLQPELSPDRDTVKVLLDRSGRRAVDFSREPLGGPCLAHLGVYSFTRTALQRFARMPTSLRETREQLEQLRVVEAGLPVGVRVVQHVAAAVNRPGDLDRIERALMSAHSSASRGGP